MFYGSALQPLPATPELDWAPVFEPPDSGSPAELQAGGEASPVAASSPGRLLTLPILIVLLLGAAWRFYTSAAYWNLYRSLFGPLDEY